MPKSDGQEDGGQRMTDLIKVILIALSCPIVLPLVIDEEDSE